MWFDGPSPQHLLDAISGAQGVPVLSKLSMLINHFQSGKLPLPFAPFFAGACLSALEKKGEVYDVRPIAAGETLRRLVAKCLCASVKERAALFFTPYQHGVATPAGGERVAHFTRHIFQQHQDDSDFVVLKVDLRNAFNMFSRERMLKIVMEDFPEIAK